MPTGTLYVVATPIGNLEDMTLRGLRILKEVALIAAEDTRHTKKLLTHFGIPTPLTSCFEHNERVKAASIINKLKDGASVALVSDAGTPGISDPGYRLIKAAIEHGVPVVAIPGPCALISALCVSGLPLDRFTYLGFVPSGATERQRFFLSLKGREETFVMYESARRIRRTLDDIIGILGDAQTVVGREMTKMYEEVLRGTATELAKRLAAIEPKGEITLVIRTEKTAQAALIPAEELSKLMESGLSFKDAVAVVVDETGLPRREVYAAGLKVRDALKSGG